MRNASARRVSLDVLRCIAIISLATAATACGGGDKQSRRAAVAAPPKGSGATATRLATPRRSNHAYAQTGDIALGWASGPTFAFATDKDLPGHRPLRGALLDASPTPGDRSDPLLWLREAVIDRDGAAHALVASDVDVVACGSGAGVRVHGSTDGTEVQSVWCSHEAEDGARHLEVISRTKGAAEGTSFAWELNPGTATPIVMGRTEDWEGEAETSFVVIAEHGVALLVEGEAGMIALRRLVHIASEAFPAALVLKPQVHASSNTEVRLSARVFAGDALDGLSNVRGSRRAATIKAEPGSSIRLLGEKDELVADGTVGPSGTRNVELPAGLGRSIEVRTPRGVIAATRSLADGAPTNAPLLLDVGRAKEGKVVFQYEGAAGVAAAVHVLLDGVDGTPTPEPRVVNAPGDPRHAAFADRRSVYLPHGAGSIGLAPGRYRVVASAGPTHTLAIRVVDVRDDETVRIEGIVREVVDTKEWVSGDFHLHAAASPDSRVSLDARVATLAAAHLDLGVATDHNRMVDYGPSVRSLDLEDRLVTVIGDEMTTAGPKLLGHFNAFPFPAPTGSPEAAAIPYFLVPAAEMFASARDGGARVVQVNHARMPPRIGYLDLTAFDAKTGASNAELAFGFDAFEAHNGLWLEQEARVREGVHDLVGLARRGVLVAATGNSDSHKLHWETAGWPRTYVHTAREPRATRADRTLGALLGRKTTVSAGPFVEATVDGADVGAIVHPSNKRVRVHAKVSAPAWIPVDRVEIWKDDVVVRTIAIEGTAKDGVRYEGDVDVAVTDDCTIVVWADGKAAIPDGLPLGRARPIGFTTPFYVDADGDGAVRVPAAH